MRRGKLIALALVMAVVLASCQGWFLETATQHQLDSPDTRPWWCHSADGLGGHHAVDSGDPVPLEGIAVMEMPPKGMLSWDDCLVLSDQLDQALAYAEQWPTLGDAEAAGWHAAVNYVGGMGTHHVDPGPHEALDILSPDFDPLDPEFPGTRMDDVFDPTRPEFLQYAGNTPDAPLIGMSWYVKTDTGMPPPGFVGDNDHWHVHERLCFSRSSISVIGENLTDQQCEDRNGINLHLDDYYMVHTWIVPGTQFHPDVFVNHHPCVKGGGVAPLSDSCWDLANMHAADMEA